jgi:dihydrodiol dehydrogenase / D-xylose 1-dehydrogenase (NADP)
MEKRMKWAILGTGKIANRFATALNNIPECARLVAVGSRNQKTADDFADTYGIKKRYVGYENVVSDPEIDIVYIGTPGVFHRRDAAVCLEGGKHVLCEKVLTINAKEAESLIGLARSKSLFLMEAMWTRFFPIHIRIRELLKENTIGDLRGLIANFAATVPADIKNRFYDVKLGAGVLLDLGSYGISWGYKLFGPPEEVTGLPAFGETGADYQSAYVMRHRGGQLTTVTASMISYDVKEAVVFGSKGKIVVHDPWYKPHTMTVYIEGREPELIEMPLGKYNGYEYEALAVMECIRDGKTECDIMPLDETLEIIRIIDRIRQQWGFKYPSEE